jgi:ABC-type branched-subunit amino acid transport system ATPase component
MTQPGPAASDWHDDGRIADEGTPLLQVTDVTKGFGGLRAVNRCSFSVDEGKIVGLIGPNGAGKSTVIDLISGFKRSDAGKIKLRGREIQHLPAYRISQLGLLRTFQTPREWGHLTVMENMLVAAAPGRRETIWRSLLTRRYLHKLETADRQRAIQLLRELDLIQQKDEWAGNLSAGQKRLLEFARIMMAKPQLVLLDEPLAGINPILVDRIGAAVQALNSHGVTIVMVEHRLPFVEALCDSVIVMALGASIAEGTLEQLRRNPVVVDAYLGEVPAGV